MLMYLFILPLVLCFILFFFSFFSYDKKRITTVIDKDFPKVSVLVAARNEEHTILKCLEAINLLTYSNYEVLIGNDHSEDNTLAIIQQFIQDKPHFSVFTIEDQLGEARGKSNVLAQLSHKAEGDYFFITDADTQVPPSWIENMFEGFDDDIGIVTGVTTLSTTNWFHVFQQIDWLYALSLVKVVSDIGFPVTSMGNNMAVKKEAYWQTGGYENLPFSITEDFQLFKKIIDKGWGYKNLFHRQVLAFSLPVKHLTGLLYQRKRWMVGAMQLPFHFLLLLFLQALFYPLMLLLFFVDVDWTINIIILKAIIQTAFIIKAYRKLHLSIPVLSILLFEFYSSFLSMLMLLFYFTPIKVKWKGRKY